MLMILKESGSVLLLANCKYSFQSTPALLKTA